MNSSTLLLGIPRCFFSKSVQVPKVKYPMQVSYVPFMSLHEYLTKRDQVCAWWGRSGPSVSWLTKLPSKS